MWGGGLAALLLPRRSGWSTSARRSAASHKHSHGARAVVGYAIVVAFAVVLPRRLPIGLERQPDALFWTLYARRRSRSPSPSASSRTRTRSSFCVYLAVLTVASRGRVGAGVIAVLAVARSALAAAVRPGWDGGVDWSRRLDRPAGLARDVRLLPDHPVQHRAGRGPRRGRPAGGRERAHPHRPRPARPARPLADDDHGQGRAGPAAGRARRARARAAPRSPRSSSCRGARSATSGPRWPATAR